MSCQIHAANLYWDADGTGGGTALNYGDGIFSATSALWLTGTPGTAGGTYSGWTNSNADVANIGAASGYTAATAAFTMTLGSELTMNGITASSNLTKDVTIDGVTNGFGLTLAAATGNTPLGIGNNSTTANMIINAVLKGTAVLTKFNAGTVIFAQNNTYSGATIVRGVASTSTTASGGTLQIGNGAATGSLGSGGVTFSLNGTQGQPSTLAFNRSDSITVANSMVIDPTVTTLGGTIRQNSATGKLTLSGAQTLGASSAVTMTYNIADAAAQAVDTEIAGAITGSGNLVKSGAGTLQLSNTTNAYTGATTVSAGRLLLTNATGSATGTGTVALSGGTTTTLSGTGASTGLLTVTAGSRLAPGVNTSSTNGNFGAAGTLTLGSTGGMTLTNVNLDFDLASTATAGGAINDLLATGGTLNLGTVSIAFNELNGTLLTGTAYTLISGATAVTGFSATGLAAATTFVNGVAYTATYALNGNDLTVTFAAVPEPSTWAMLTLGLGTMAWTLRRQRAPRGIV